MDTLLLQPLQRPADIIVPVAFVGAQSEINQNKLCGSSAATRLF
jgi:hypothetical protein